MNVKGKTAVVTGVSRGIGKETVLQLLEEGAKVFGWGLRKPDYERENFHFIKTDVRNLKEVEAATNETLEKSDDLHILVNNAGLGYFGKLENLPLEHWHEMFDTNVNGMFYCTRSLLPALKKAGGAHMVNLSSVAGQMGMSEAAAYCATKFAVKGFSHSLFKELRQYGIKVSCVYPASTATDFFTRAKSEIAYDSMMEAKDVVAAILYLLKTPDSFLPVDIEMRPMMPKTL